MAMDEKVIIINPGSASKKYAIYEGGKNVYFAHFERENNGYVVTCSSNTGEQKQKIGSADFDRAINFFLEKLFAEEVITKRGELSCAAIRVVSPGRYFSSHRKIDNQYISELKKQKPNAPLHIASLLDELGKIKEVLPETELFGISDTAFHGDMPKKNRLYAIPEADAEKYDLHRFGYHGISVESVLPKAKKLLGALPSRTIICHLGGGASVTAVKNGKSVINSMGYTPLEGLVMSTRVGDIDPGILIKLLNDKVLSDSKDLDRYLNKNSGLLGLSGQSSDIRVLLELEQENEKAKLALDVYAQRVKEYIGAYTALLNGLDLVVFTGTVGERSSDMRERVCSDMDGLGIRIDEVKNIEVESADEEITKQGSAVKLTVLTTDEMEIMARKTVELAGL